MTKALLPTVSDFDTELEQVKRSRAEIDALRKQGRIMPKGEMIGKRYVAPHAFEYLAPILQQYNAAKQEGALNERESVLGKAMQANAQELMGNVPKARVEDVPGPWEEGLTSRETVQPTQQDKMAWAQQLQGNPLTKALGAAYGAHALVKEPELEEARQFRGEQAKLKAAADAKEFDERQRLEYEKLGQQASIARQASLDRQYSVDERAESDRKYNALLAKMNKLPTESSAESRERQKIEAQMENVYKRTGIIDEVLSTIPKATGSKTGAWVDEAMKLTPWSLEGADATAKLKALEGNLTLYGPKYGGGSSNQDVIDYKAAVGTIANPNASRSSRITAVKEVQRIAKKDYEIQRKKAIAWNQRVGEHGVHVDVPDELPPEEQKAEDKPVVAPTVQGPLVKASRVSGGKIGGVEPIVAPVAPAAAIDSGVVAPSSFKPPPEMPEPEVGRAKVLLSEYKKASASGDPRSEGDKLALSKELAAMGIDAETGAYDPSLKKRRRSDKIVPPSAPVAAAKPDKVFNPATGRLE